MLWSFYVTLTQYSMCSPFIFHFLQDTTILQQFPYKLQACPS